jgi:uroporphyrinogen decarboxylase
VVFIDACFKKETKHTPIWMMRQAGRYLPEYRATRAKAKDFIDFCRNSELATEATLQPIDILDVDAAILFSDILVIPLEMGMKLEFIEKKGPVFHDPVSCMEDLARLCKTPEENLGYVYEAIGKIRKNLAPDKALIGFAGSPWTLATYMVEGQGSKTFEKIKKEVYKNPVFMKALLATLTESVKKYLINQIDAGANAVQVFDSWGGALEEEKFFEFSWKYMLEISEYIKKERPNIPVILFSKGIGTYMDKIYGQFDVFGVDWGTPMKLAKDKLFEKYALQGNLEPSRLYDRGEMLKGAEELLNLFKGESGHIFNLGHGMIPDLPAENAKELVSFVHSYTKRS